MTLFLRRQFDCNRCGDTHVLKLHRVRDIGELLARGHIKVEASPIYALSERHSITISLKQVVISYLMKGLREMRSEEMAW